MSKLVPDKDAAQPANQYIFALKYNWLTGLYDPILSWLLRESTFKRQLMRQGDIKAGEKILDVGCGTGTLAIMIKVQYPDNEVTGLDGDENILQIAQEKVRKSGLEIKLVKGLSYNLPYPTNSFDKVFSSLLFHHLPRDAKIRTMKEIYRVLRPGGEVHVADWGKPANAAMRLLFFFVQFLDGFATTRDNVLGLLPEFMQKAGLVYCRETDSYKTLFGTLSFYAAKKIA